MLRIKLTEIALLSKDRLPVTVFPDHIASIQPHEDGGSWVRLNGTAIRVAETEDEIMDIWRAVR